MKSESCLIEKLYQATLSLVGGEGEIKDRLESAAITLSVVQLEKTLSPEFRNEFNSIHDELAKRKAVGGEGRIKATIQELTNMEATRLADRIFHLYVHLQHEAAL